MTQTQGEMSTLAWILVATLATSFLCSILEAVFLSVTHSFVALLKGNDATRKQFVELAGLLASYNEGLIGPGHCDSETDAS